MSEKRKTSGVLTGKRTLSDPLITELEHALMPGRFVRYDDMFRYVEELERVRNRVVELAQIGEIERGISLFEMLLSGCYEKAEECDDSSGSLGMFFHRLFCDWVQARQRAGRPAAETIQQVVRWKANDRFGMCYRLEEDLAKVLDEEGYLLLVAYFQDRIAQAMQNPLAQASPAIFEYPNEVRLPANVAQRNRRGIR